MKIRPVQENRNSTSSTSWNNLQPQKITSWAQSLTIFLIMHLTYINKNKLNDRRNKCRKSRREKLHKFKQKNVNAGKGTNTWTRACRQLQQKYSKTNGLKFKAWKIYKWKALISHLREDVSLGATSWVVNQYTLLPSISIVLSLSAYQGNVNDKNHYFVNINWRNIQVKIWRHVVPWSCLK
jgi:hypothetical protein